MMDIASMTAATARPSPVSTSPGPLGAQTDFQTFLTMLTAQMKNQDPLEPMNASDFASQLATFSNVEQSTYTNELLTAMLNQGGMSDLGGWVGMEARILGSVWYSGEAIDLTPDPALGADRATLVVRDATGAIVDSRPLDPEGLAYRWDGLDEAGNPLPEGAYSFEIESRLGDDLLDTQPVAAYAPIQEARFESGGTILVLPGGLWVDSGSVTGLRQPRT